MVGLRDKAIGTQEYHDSKTATLQSAVVRSIADSAQAILSESQRRLLNSRHSWTRRTSLLEKRQDA